MQEKFIHIKGARENNLKNVEVRIPHGRLTVVTGVSGSGKSSLVFDTLYAEGHRRYVECLSTYARQFLERIDKPDVDFIEGISPAIAFDQRNPVKHSRSTVGTATEIADYCRLLYAKVGEIVCPGCGRVVQPEDATSVAETLIRDHEGERVLIGFPIRMDDGLSLREVYADLVAQGFIRIREGDKAVSIDPEKRGDSTNGEPADVVVDRMSVRAARRSRLVESLETAFAAGRGAVRVKVVEGPLRRFTDELHCAECEIDFEPPTPELFSFNSARGACPACRGFGNVLEYDLDAIVPDRGKSLAEGAIEPWTVPRYRSYFDEQLRYLSRRERVNLHKPFCKLTKRQLRLVLEGTKGYIGVYPFFAQMESKKYKVHIRMFLRKYRTTVDCSACGGSRLRPEARYVQIMGKSIVDVMRMSVKEVRRFFDRLRLRPYQEEVASDVLAQIRFRLAYLDYVGLDYLTLDRLTRTLSGGEAQRVNLATQLGSQLTGTLYILDEPTVGLHPCDNARLLDILRRLTDQGNTVVVVEHDRQVIQAADFLIDMGPLAGEQGGRVVFAGTERQLREEADTLTAKYLRRDEDIPVPSRRRPVSGPWLELIGAEENNLKGVDLRIPLGTFTCITGVSGAGKSSLVHDTLYRALDRIFHGSVERTGRFRAIYGFENLRDVLLLDQKPIGKTPRSNPVTYVKAYDVIRKLLASTRQARVKGFTARHFSFNIEGGRCPQCRGEGYEKIEMHFMADVYVKCSLCGGARFKQEVLDVRYRGLNVHQILQMTIEGALDFFEDEPALCRRLSLLHEVGLGYLRLGQPATTLSGGEAQRLKISAELMKKKPTDILYILDEPTTGLHFDDVKKLLRVLNRLVSLGNTVLVVEHNMDVIKTSDWVIDLGPEGGDAGGSIVAEGTPEAVACSEGSRTGSFLADVLQVGEAMLSS